MVNDTLSYVGVTDHDETDSICSLLDAACYAIYYFLSHYQG